MTKSHNSVFDCKNTTFCEHHKYKQWIPNLLLLWPYEKHLSGVVSNLEPIHNVMALWSHHSIIFPFTQQKRERKLLMSVKQKKPINCIAIDLEKEAFPKWKLKTHKFSTCAKPQKKSYSKTNFSNYFTFSPTEINRTPRSLL